MDYYKKDQLLAAVDKNDTVLKEIDKWEAHEKGILHRGFTVCLFYQDKMILQHRKHPVFDQVFDLTCSSHPYFKDGGLQKTEDAVIETLKREWDIVLDDLSSPLQHKGHIYYQAEDPLSIYKEHEICHLYCADIDKLPSPNFDFAYGFSLMTKDQIMDKKAPIRSVFAPWVPLLLAIL